MSTHSSSPNAVAALHELRSARRSRRLEELHWVDTLYRLYVFVIVLCVGIWWLGTILGRSVPDERSVTRINDFGVIGSALLFGLLLLAAVRSGSRGGPLASEGPDVIHVLSAPIAREIVLRRPFLHVLRRGAFLGAGAGAFVGEVLTSVIPGSRIGWLLRGISLGAVAGVLWMAVAIASAGKVQTRRLVRLGVLGFMALTGVEYVANQGSSHRLLLSPLSTWAWGLFVGSPAKSLSLARPLGIVLIVVSVVALVGSAAALALARRGLCAVDMERAAYRARLVGQLRFAVSTQDLRTVLLLRRQLSSESPRRRPWFRVTQPKRSGLTGAVVVRTLRGVGRWPAGRFVRIVMLGLVSSVAAVGGWRGGIVLFAVVGLCAFVAGLDVVEGIGQQIDHPTLAASLPRHRGRLMNRQLIAPIGVLTVLGLPGAVLGAIAEWNNGSGAAAAVVLLICWAAGGAVGGGVSTVMGPPDFALSIQSPETAFLLTAFPAILSVLTIGGPLLSAYLAARNGPIFPGFSRAIPPVILLLYVGTIVITSKGEPVTRVK